MSDFFSLIQKWSELAVEECTPMEDGGWLVEGEALGLTAIEIHREFGEAQKYHVEILYLVQDFIVRRNWMFNLCYAGKDLGYWAKVWVEPTDVPERFLAPNPAVAILLAYLDGLKRSIEINRDRKPNPETGWGLGLGSLMW